MNSLALVRSQIEARFPAAFLQHTRFVPERLPMGIPAIDALTQGGIPLNCLTEICGSSVASSGKTTVVLSLLAQTTGQGRFCALVDASDSFDPATAEAAGTVFSHLLWVRCGKKQQKLPPLEQAFKVADMLLQSSGFGLIAVDLSGISERVVRKVPMSTWFRFSRVVEKQPTALVFIEQQPHATNCAELVLKLTSQSVTFSGKLLMNFNLKVELLRTRAKKGAQSVSPEFPIKTQWA